MIPAGTGSPSSVMVPDTRARGGFGSPFGPHPPRAKHRDANTSAAVAPRERESAVITVSCKVWLVPRRGAGYGSGTVSPPAGLAAACHAVTLTPSMTNRTDPSSTSRFTPPVW